MKKLFSSFVIALTSFASFGEATPAYVDLTSIGYPTRDAEIYVDVTAGDELFRSGTLSLSRLTTGAQAVISGKLDTTSFSTVTNDFWSAMATKTSFSGVYGDLSGLPTLGTAAAQNSTAFATASQGALAATAVQPAGLTKAAVGLGNADNTSDANKPVSTAAQTALNGKEPTITAGTALQYWAGDKTWKTAMLPAETVLWSMNANTVYSNTYGAPILITQPNTYAFALVAGGAYQRVMIAPTVAGPYIPIFSDGEQTLLLGLAVSKERTTTAVIPRNYNFYLTNILSGAGNTITKLGTNTLTVLP